MYELLARMFGRPLGLVHATANPVTDGRNEGRAVFAGAKLIIESATAIAASAAQLAIKPRGAQANLSRVRHLYAIERVRDVDLASQFRHRYYCVRCHWSFLVNGGGGVKVVDGANRPLAREEAMRRALTFSDGPCPMRPIEPGDGPYDASSAVERERRPLALVRPHGHAVAKDTRQHATYGSKRESSV